MAANQENQNFCTEFPAEHLGLKPIPQRTPFLTLPLCQQVLITLKANLISASACVCESKHLLVSVVLSLYPCFLVCLLARRVVMCMLACLIVDSINCVICFAAHRFKAAQFEEHQTPIIMWACHGMPTTWGGHCLSDLSLTQWLPNPQCNQATTHQASHTS